MRTRGLKETDGDEVKFTFIGKIEFIVSALFIWTINLLNTKNNHM